MTEQNYALVERLGDWAAQHGHTPAELAQAWLLSHPEVSSVISGATRLEQVEQNAKAGEWTLTPAEVEEVSQILL